MGRESRLLIDEAPLQVLPSLAVLIGLNEAIFLQQVHYWCEINREANAPNHFHEGRWWTYNTVAGWHEKNFKFWHTSTIRRVITSLVKKGLLIEGNYNRLAIDRTKWYTIDYDALRALDPESVNKSICSEWTNGSVQNEQMQSPKMDKPLPETNTEITTETSSYVVVPPAQVVCSLHNTVMKKRGPDAEGNIWWSHKVGGQWCQGVPGDQWSAPEDRRLGRKPEDYISGEFSDIVQY